MDQPYDVITFDCYGTLIDWERGVRDGFAAAAAASGRPVDTSAAMRLFAETEPVVQAEAFRSYRDVLAETGLPGRLQGELAGHLVEGGRDGEHHLGVLEAVPGAVSGAGSGAVSRGAARVH